jgi:hypothetical protein
MSRRGLVGLGRKSSTVFTFTASGSWVATFTGLLLLDGCGQGGCGGGGSRPDNAKSTDAGGGGGGGGGPAMRDQRVVPVVKGTTYTITIGNDAVANGLGATTNAGSVGQGTSGADTVFTDGASVNEVWQGGQAGRGGRWSAALEDLRAWGGVELAGADLPSSTDGNLVPYYLLVPGFRMGGMGGRTGSTTPQASASVASTRTNRATAGAAGTNATGIAGSGGGSGATGPFGGIGGAGGNGGDGSATTGTAGSAGSDAPATSYGAGGGGGGGGGNGATASGNGGDPGKGGPGILIGYRLR